MNYPNQSYSNPISSIELHNYSAQQPIVMGIPVRLQQNNNPYPNYDQETLNSVTDETRLLVDNQHNKQNFVALNSQAQPQDSLHGDKQIDIEPHQETKTPSNDAEFIIHDVKNTDTLLGLSIQYQVSESRIKAANDLYNDDIYYRKQLKIPNPKANNLSNIEIDPIKAQQDQIAYFFKNTILQGKDKQMKVARIYLEAADWDIKQAEEDYKEDLESEKKSQKNKKYW